MIVLRIRDGQSIHEAYGDATAAILLTLYGEQGRAVYEPPAFVREEAYLFAAQDLRVPDLLARRFADDVHEHVASRLRSAIQNARGTA